MDQDLSFMYEGAKEIIRDTIKWENMRGRLESNPRYLDVVRNFYDEIHIEIIQHFFDLMEDKYYIIKKDCVDEDDIKKLVDYPTSAPEYDCME